MAITPMEQYGTIGRTHDFSIQRTQELSRESAMLTNIADSNEKTAEKKLTTVRTADETGILDKRFDAKEKGSNEYYGDGGNGRKKENAEEKDGKVVIKGCGSFDMKI